MCCHYLVILNICIYGVGQKKIKIIRKEIQNLGELKKYDLIILCLGGRSKVYKNIVDGNYEVESGVPESFNVLSKEIKALGINLELEDSKEN